MLRRGATTILVAIMAAGCGGSDAAVDPPDVTTTVPADDLELTILGIAAFEWGDDPEPGHTTPFSFEIAAPAVNGTTDVSYWLEVHADNEIIATSPRFDLGAEADGDLGGITVSHGLPVPHGASGEFAVVVHVLENSTGAHLSHTETVVLP